MITLEQTGGVGINARYVVRQEGKPVATITRYGRSHWKMYSVHYGIDLGVYGNIGRAKAAAHAIDYPTKADIYERLCQETERRRRAYKERECAHDLARLARELVRGSNSAHGELERLTTEIDAWAVDRSDTRAARRAAAEAVLASGKPYPHWSESIPLYPDAPEQGV